ncbi:B3 domain-containing protein At5g42700 isoform X2 [Spinacia oleracea]|uniref:B3 domain-containing protein At5g42700 isoform X2 n=1 Tax=Spinacia oleracea TaxID=3562 RepID=A0A9R0IDB1_SPIOL|nr:B3 domain-containing protein At5g42700-like isoform X2 [Spinacia oleracea]
MGKVSYEERRQKRVEENKKRLDDLNLTHLSQALKNLSPKSSPIKKVWKPRTVENRMVAVRRSARVAKHPAPVHLPRSSSPRKSYGVVRGNYGVARDEERASTIEKAEKLVGKLEEEGFPTVIRPMLPSHVTGCFWLGLPSEFCRTRLPNNDATVTLVDEEGDEYPSVYLARKTGLSGGWRGFALAHELVDGDTVVFQVISHSIFKVYIIRRSDELNKVLTSED